LRKKIVVNLITTPKLSVKAKRFTWDNVARAEWSALERIANEE